MPFVFVHGVNTREGEDYEREEKVRNAFLREYVAPAVGIAPEHEIFVPYWGGEGVAFWKNLEVVPGGGGLEKFGAQGEVPPSLGMALGAGAMAASGSSVEAIAKASPETAIDLLWDFAVEAAETEADFMALAAAYRAADQKLTADTGAQWLAQTSAADLADTVFVQVEAAPAAETFGGTGLSAMLEEAGKRLALALPDALSLGAVAMARKPLTRKIASFIGDAFVYLAERGDGQKAGPIASAVIEALTKAHAVAKATGEPLIVISHSFGGEIVYDILTHYAKDSDLEVDAWVTVGSQVGLFEEMSLLWTSPGRKNPQAVAGGDALPAPERVARWINIVDANDVLGFLVLPVFTGSEKRVVQDFKYDTGFPVTGAHSGYFRWPSFYKRLARRLA